jgi:hypothetical protein
MMFFSDSNNVTPDTNTVTPGLLAHVTPGLTRGPFYKLDIEMKEQNGFRIKPGMTCVKLNTVGLK